jgi:hypothetical protein
MSLESQRAYLDIINYGRLYNVIVDEAKSALQEGRSPVEVMEDITFALCAVAAASGRSVKSTRSMIDTLSNVEPATTYTNQGAVAEA